MGRVYMHLTYDQRLAIKQMLERGNSKKEIAESIGVHTSTIYREIDRGTDTTTQLLRKKPIRKNWRKKGRQQFWKKIRNWRIISQN